MAGSFSGKIASSISWRKSWQVILAATMLLLAFVFFRDERQELAGMSAQLKSADWQWLLVGILIASVYISLQSVMYMASFRSAGLKISFHEGVELFLKRNLLSLFLPAGGFTSLAYMPISLKKQKMDVTQVYQASAIYGYVGLLTVLLVGIPVVFYILLTNQNFGNSWIWMLLLATLLAVSFWAARSFQQKGLLYRFMETRQPDSAEKIHMLFSGKFDKKSILLTIVYSTLIEFSCIGLVYAAMRTAGVAHSLEAAAVGYIVSVIFMSVSPFLRGLGVVEFSLVLIFQQYGYSNQEGLTITLFYRVFEFWLPLVLGVVSFVSRGKDIFVRVMPAVFLFASGVVNLVSVSTLPVAARWKELSLYIPQELLHASNLLTLIMGIALIITSFYLIRGYRNAWVLALVFGVLSIVGHLGKGLDFEEAIFIATVMIMLILSRKQYFIVSSMRWMRIGFGTFFLFLGATVLFTFLSFYWIHKHHFGIDFTWEQSVVQVIRSFLFLAGDGLQPQSRFAVQLIYLVHFMGFMSWILLLLALFRPYRFATEKSNDQIGKAEDLLHKFGNSANDYFKTQPDKELFFSQQFPSFVAFRTAHNFAVVLEEPVCDEKDKLAAVVEFEDHCRKRSLKVIFYRVSEKSLPIFESLEMKRIKIGQEAVVDVVAFTLEGKEKKSLRNGLKALEKKGFSVFVHQPPHSREFVSRLKAVSDEWLEAFDKKEMVFSQGMFDESVIVNQPVIVVGDADGKTVAFLNIIPDFAKGECTYDLIRRTADSPGGCVDAMIIRLIEYARNNFYLTINMGLVPFSGIENSDVAAEQIVRFVSQKSGSLKHFKSLQFFKEKYARSWENKYLVFEHDFDLLQVPSVLNSVMKP